MDGFVGAIAFHQNTLMVITTNIKTNKVLHDKFVLVSKKYKSVRDFVNDIPNIFTKRYKAVLIDVFGFNSSEYSNNVEFCKAVQEKLNVTKIPYYFIPVEHFSVFTQLYAAKIQMKVNEKFLLISALKDKFYVECYQFTENGYVAEGVRYISFHQSDEEICENIYELERDFSRILVKNEFSKAMMSRLISKILPFFSTPNNKIITTVLKNPDEDFNAGKCLIEAGKWIIDKKLSKNFILPSTTRKYFVLLKNFDEFGIFVNVDRYVPLPHTEMLEVEKRSITKNFLAYADGNTASPTIIEELQLPSECHAYKFILTIDENNIPKCEVKGIIMEEVLSLPIFLDKYFSSNIPVIGFSTNFSVICIDKNDGNGYEFIDEWNGIFGRESFISFADEKPKYCEKAAEDYANKPSAVISDFLKIVAMPADEAAAIVEASLMCKFSFTKDDENPVLLEFDNFDGTRKAASPAFLMALLLKEHLRVIKNVIGEKPSKLGFWFFNDYSDEKTIRIRSGFIEACELLKIEYEFIDF